MASPLRLASCPQVAQFDMSGQDLSLSQLSVDYWGAGDMTHTQSFITPAVNIEAHRTKYASEIIKRGTDTELWATDPSWRPACVKYGRGNLCAVQLHNKLSGIFLKTTYMECCQLTLFEVEFIHFVNFTVDIVWGCWGSANYFPTFCDFWSNWEYPGECDKLSYVFSKSY